MVSEYRGMHLDPLIFLCGPLGLFHYAGTTWALSGNVFCCVFGTTWTHPYFCFTTCFKFFSYIFGLVSFVILFSLFFASDVRAAASRTFGVLLCEKLWLSAFNSRELITQLLIIVDRFVSLRRGASVAPRRFLFSQLLQSQFPYICIIYLKIH